MKNVQIKVALAGDSILDNAAYVEKGESVYEHLKSILPESNITKLAVDGSLVEDVETQFNQLDPDTDALFVSAGGCNALNIKEYLNTYGIQQGFQKLNDYLFHFRLKYQRMLLKAVKLIGAKKITLLSIYSTMSDFTEDEKNVCRMFNNVISEIALEYKVRVLNMNEIFCDEKDYSEISNINPSEQGGFKIAGCIFQLLEPCTQLCALVK